MNNETENKTFHVTNPQHPSKKKKDGTKKKTKYHTKNKNRLSGESIVRHEPSGEFHCESVASTFFLFPLDDHKSLLAVRTSRCDFFGSSVYFKNYKKARSRSFATPQGEEFERMCETKRKRLLLREVTINGKPRRTRGPVPQRIQ